MLRKPSKPDRLPDVMLGLMVLGLGYLAFLLVATFQ